jgi:dihydrofolate reductase
MESPEKWHFPFFDGELAATIAELLHDTDGLLLGRITYQESAGQQLKGIHTYVVSTTLGSVASANVTVLNGELTESVGALKHARGRDIAVSGSGTLIRSLLEHDLVDELNLLVHPVIIGRGKRLFADDTTAKSLKRTICKAFGSGVVHLCYEPVPG